MEILAEKGTRQIQNKVATLTYSIILHLNPYDQTVMIEWIVYDETYNGTLV